MRGSAVAIAVMAVMAVMALGPLGRLATAAPAPPTGFDHRQHDRATSARSAEPLPCARCHAIRRGALVGRPDHATCFGSCHGPPPRRGALPGERPAICGNCHAGAQATVAYPPYRIDPDFAIAVGHRRHGELACTQCHTADATPPPAAAPPHQRCAGCHDGSGAAGKGPAMAACTGCHTAATGAPAPALLRAEINVAGAFSHVRHAGHTARGTRCVTCHAAVRDTDENLIRAPSAASCAVGGCHDGAAGFSITAACTRCHRDPDLPDFKVERPAQRYSHAQHAAQVSAGCASCHPLSRSGEVRVVGHAPCATCHAEDFGRRRPQICGACHNGTEPWRALVADRGPAERTEFGATIDHGKHPEPCAGCHALTTPVTQLRPPRGHRACTGAACHAVTGGPAPQLEACEACHRRDLAHSRDLARLAAPWSVRAAFDHAAHAAAPACEVCHVDLRAPDVTALPAPPKPTCAPCHDGRAAFKLTGTTCTRCHQGARPAPPSP